MLRKETPTNVLNQHLLHSSHFHNHLIIQFPSFDFQNALLYFRHYARHAELVCSSAVE